MSVTDVFVGDSTTALLLHYEEGEGACSTLFFYQEVMKFYIAAVKKFLKVYDFKSTILHAFTFLDPLNCQNITLSTFDLIEQTIPIVFDKMAVKLEHREFVLDTEVHAGESEDAVEFWIRVSHTSSPMDELKYHKLASLALQLLSIPSSNADSERVFSLVRRIKTEFRSSLLTETVCFDRMPF